MHFYVDVLVTIKEKNLILIFNLLIAQKVPPHLLDAKRRNQKRRKRNGILECNSSCLDAKFTVTRNYFYFSDASVDAQDNR